MASNKFLTIADISYKSADILSNSLGFTSKVNRSYDDRFARTGAKIGTITNMRLPAQFRFAEGSNIDIQALNDASMPLALTTLYQRSFQVDSVDMTMSVDDFAGRYLNPALVSIANQVDRDGLALAKQYAQNAVGTPGTAPASTADFQGIVGAARRKMMENLAPAGEPMYMVAPPSVNELGYKYLTNIFNPQNVIGEQYTSGVIARAGGFDWMESQLVPNYTNGVVGTAGTVTGGGQSGSTITTGSWGATTTLDVGTTITFAGVYAINAQTKESLGYLAQFTVTAKNVAGATQVLSVSPALVGPGDPRQNVSALPAGGAAVAVLGASGSSAPMAIGFHKNAFVFGTADLDTPVDGATGYVASVPELNLSLRVVKQFDIRSNANLMRIDLLGGWAPLYPQLSCKTIFG